jgi:hypothetical protein
MLPIETFPRVKPIQALRQIKSAIRHRYAWPGGYPLFVVMADGEALSCEAARTQWRQIVYSTMNGLRDGWRALGASVNYEETALFCAHTGKRIESAYGEEE